MSTESGIPDFRSREGIWASYDPSEVASLDGFRRDPARVWEFYARRLAVHAEAEPNDAHRALARLEELGLVEAVVTQNVDGLHQRAGSRNVVEVHGSIRSAVCTSCHAQAGAERVLAGLPLPTCECGEILKPGVVLFGELLPVAALEYATALRAARPAAARRRLDARGLSRSRAAARDAPDGWHARDRQSRPDRARRGGRAPARGERRDDPPRDPRGARERALGRGAPERAFAENPPAVRALRALDLVRDPCVLAQDVRGYGLVPVQRALPVQRDGHRSFTVLIAPDVASSKGVTFL